MLIVSNGGLPEREPGKANVQGNAAFTRRHLRLLNKRLQSAPDNPTLHVEKGDVLRSLGSYDEALLSYQRAIRLDPEQSDAYRGKGATYEQKGQEIYEILTQQAEESYQRARELGVLPSNTGNDTSGGTGDLTRNSSSPQIQAQPAQPEPQQNQVVVQIGVNEDATQLHEIDLETANAILDAVIGTHGSQITPETPLDKGSGYSYEQVRQAEEVVCSDLMRRHQVQPDPLGIETLIKQTPDGKLRLIMYKGVLPSDTLNRPSEYYAIQLNLSNNGQNIFDTFIPLSDNTLLAGFTGFRDWRTGTFASPVFDNSLSTFRSIWLGLQVLNANVRAWDTPGVIKPEQLANPPVPPAK